MNIQPTQDRRIGRLDTVLGGDSLLLHRMDGHDHVNDLFEYRVEALSTTPDLDFDAILGSHATVTLFTQDNGPANFDGIVTQVRWVGVNDSGTIYELMLRPWFWLAGKRRNQRIFHEKTVEEILDELLGEYAYTGDNTYENKLSGSYPTLEYTVQYRESDLEFACRMMERFGISYHFVHGEGFHTLVLTDEMAAFAVVDGGSREFIDLQHRTNVEREHFWEWAAARGMTTGAVRLTDYNFKTPTVAMEVDQTGDAAYTHGKIESFDYPGIYPDQGQGSGVVATRTTQERSGDFRQMAKGDVMSMRAGNRVVLDGKHAPGGAGIEYLCLGATHAFQNQGYTSGGGDYGDVYSATYEMTPTDAPFASTCKTCRPIVHGPQTAVVVGEGEIDCDEYGRILVKFHWDREEAYSMRCRVSQNWAGKGWGGMVIPRIGMEVVVEFLEGDPDQPLVTGCVFNGKNDAPYPLPQHKTKSILRSDTHQSKGYNEISFEDEAGRENVFVHAQKDHTVKVLNDMSANVLANRLDSVGNNASLTVGANQSIRVGANSNTTVGGGGAALLKMLAPLVGAGGKFLKQGANKVGATGGGIPSFAGVVQGVTDMPKELAAIMKKGSFSGSSAHKEDAGADQAATAASLGGLITSIMPATGTASTTVEKFRADTTGLASSEHVGVAKNTLVGGVFTTSVGQKMITRVGDSIDTEAKGSIFTRTVKHTLQAKEKFVIGGPGGTIIIDSSGVTIKTTHLKVKSPKVDFTSGAPDQVDALKSDKPFAQDCKGK